MRKLIKFVFQNLTDEPTSGNSPLRNDPLHRRSRFRTERSGRPIRQRPAKASRTSHLLLLQLRTGRPCGRPHAVAHPIARRRVEIPFRRRRLPKPRGFLAPRSRPDRLGRNTRPFVLGDAGLRLPDLYQRRLSLRIQAALHHARQPHGLLRPHLFGAGSVERQPCDPALRGSLFRILRLGKRRLGRICGRQLPAQRIRHHRTFTAGREQTGRPSIQMDRRKLPRRRRPLAHGGHSPGGLPLRQARCRDRRFRRQNDLRRRHARRAAANPSGNRFARRGLRRRLAARRTALRTRRNPFRA